MKMRRFTPAGIIAVKTFLADIKASGQLDLVRRDQLLAGPLTEPIPALADLDLDAARVSNNVGREYDPTNYLMMHAMGPNVAGVIGSAVAAGMLLGFLG